MESEIVKILHVQKSSLQTQKIADFFENRKFSCPFKINFFYKRVANVRSALKTLGKEEFDIILLKVRTTCYSNIEKLNRLKEDHPDIPVIVLCDTMREKTGPKALQNGADDCLEARGIRPEIILRSVLLWHSRARCKKNLRELQAGLETSELIAPLLAQIENYEEDKLHMVIENIFRILGAKVDADYIRVIEYEKNYKSNLHVIDHWTKNGVVDVGDIKMEDIAGDFANELIKRLREGDPIVFESLREQDKITGELIELFTPLDDAGCVLYPMRRGENLWGILVIGFFNSKKLPKELDLFKPLSIVLNLLYERMLIFDSFTHLTETLKLINKILRHDIMNNLSTIYGVLKMFSESKDESLLESTEQAIERSLHFIEQMKSYETSLFMASTLESVDIEPILMDIAKGAKIDVEIDLGGDGNTNVMADSAIGSVFRNIIHNAIKHSGTDRLHIAIEPNENNLSVKISDFGDGIDNRYKDLLFDEGFAFGDSKGSGLGLYIVKEVMERYGGGIDVYDNEPKGTIFELNFDMA